MHNLQARLRPHAWDQKFLRRKRYAMRMGIIEQAAMVGLRNQTIGSTPGLFTLPPVRRRECRAGNSGHLGFAAELFETISDIPK